MTNMEESFGFNSIAIKQKKNICASRLDVNIESEIIKGVVRPIPLIAANMSSVINAKFYIQLYKLGAFGVLHRAQNETDYIREVETVSKECKWVAVSLGVHKEDKELAQKLFWSGANIFVIDIAHGYSDTVIEFGRLLKKKFNPIKIVLGNTTNPNMLEEVADFADGIKVGIATGAGCETKNTAGCTEGQMSAVLKFKELSKKIGIPVISDGGVKEGADFVKAILGGSNSVMAGSIFARCPESAAPEVTMDGERKKIYSGMASRSVQNEWRGMKVGTCPEGKTLYLPIGEPVENLLDRYSGALRSGITYAGGKDIKTAQKSVEFVRIYA